MEFVNILKITGVCGFVKLGKSPAKVSQAIIDQIKLVINGGQNIAASSMCFQKGQTLSIQNGALSGLVCEVVVHNGMDKILVRMDLFNRNILLDIPIDDVLSFKKGA